MRILNSILSNDFLSYLSNNLQNVQKYQQQMSTGQLISEPSDDPLGTTKLLKINNELAQNTQYKSNISNAKNWLSTTDTDLGQMNSTLQRMNELLVSAGNAAYGSDEFNSIRSEINTNIGQLSQCINSSYDGKYVFGGTRNDYKPVGVKIDTNGNEKLDYVNKDGTTPLASGDAQLNQISSNLSVEISQGVDVNYNVTANSIIEFKNDSGTAKDLRTILNNITTDLGSPTGTTNLEGRDLSDIKDAINNISNLRTNVGAMENRMTSASNINESDNTNLTELLSATDDADYADVTMKYAQTQATYSASLYVSAKVLQSTLLDYLS